MPRWPWGTSGAAMIWSTPQWIEGYSEQAAYSNQGTNGFKPKGLGGNEELRI